MESKFSVSQKDMFLPPEGYQFDGLIATTMSRHIDTVIQLLLQASDPTKQEWDERFMKIWLAKLATQKRCLVFYDGNKEGNKLSSGGGVNRLDGCTIRAVDSLCIPVKQAAVFHPKLLLARFVPVGDEQEAVYRLQVSSKNLTRGEVFEVGAWMQSVPEEKPINHNLGAFLEYLRNVEGVAEPEKAWMQTWIEELGKLSFTMDGAKDVQVTVSGVPFGEQKELLEALEGDQLEVLEEWLGEQRNPLDSRMVILSPDYETPQEHLNHYFVYAPVNRGTHAKLYVKGNTCWLGSCNLSNGGLHRNTECMVRFASKGSLVPDVGPDKACILGEECCRVTKAIHRGDPLDDFLRKHTFKMKELQEEEKIELTVTAKKEKAQPGKVQPDNVKLQPFGMNDPKGKRWVEYQPKSQRYHFSCKKTDRPCEGLLRVRISAKEVLIKTDSADGGKLTDYSGKLAGGLLRDFFSTNWFEKLYCPGGQRNDAQSKAAAEAYQWAEELLKMEQCRQDIHIYLQYFDCYTHCKVGEGLIKKYPAASAPAANASGSQLAKTGSQWKRNGGPRFQEDAVKTAICAFWHGRLRYLVADETGLGKTYVARGVIEKLFRHHKKKQRKGQNTNTPFVVYYFGSNVYLLENTLEKLKPNDSDDYQIMKQLDRLSMVFPSLYLTQRGILEESYQNYRCALDAEKINLFGFSANLLGDRKSKKGNDAERGLYELYHHAVPDEDDKDDKKDSVVLEDRSKYNEKAIKGEQLDGYVLKPSLIIVDEFHRYSDILETLGGLQKEAGVPMLMLSATPYVMYPENFHIDEEVVENEGANERKQIFKRFEDLLAFLGEGKLRAAYERCWNKNPVSQSNLDTLSQQLRKYIWRNERSASVEKEYRDLPLAEDWTAGTYDNCIQAARELQNEENCPPKRYFSLSPGVYSFPYKTSPPGESEDEDSVLPQETCSMYKSLNLAKRYAGKNRNHIPAKRWYMYNMDEESGSWNLVKERIEESLPLSLIRNYAAEPGKNLLWMPPTKRLYTVAGDEEAASFTKLLVFSGYFLVPRMVSAVFSSYVHETQQGSAVGLYQEDIPDNAIKALAGAYVLDGAEKEPVEAVLDRVKEKISEELCRSLGWNRAYAAQYAVGSPLVCAYRLTGNTQQARRIAESFDTYFKGTGISAVLAKQGIQNRKELLDYCVRHHLQAVLMEYQFCVVGESTGAEAQQKYVDQLCEALRYEGSKVHVAFPCENGYGTAPVQCRFADRFSPDGQDTGVSGTSGSGKGHQKKVENAFNSPFWPMILTTTSAGQEGIDLDRYCSRIMHYSLPSNPMAFEQRDGRVDRRRSLLARRTMNARYEGNFGDSTLSGKNYWLWLFSQEMDNSGMRPDWVQEPVDGLRQERIIPFFPLSEEYNAYQELLRWKNMYRGKMGVPTEKVNLSQHPYRLKLNKL